VGTPPPFTAPPSGTLFIITTPIAPLSWAKFILVTKEQTPLLIRATFPFTAAALSAVYAVHPSEGSSLSEAAEGVDEPSTKG
jgi:hypothetical protein